MIDYALFARDDSDCIKECPAVTCNCAAGQECVKTSKVCHACPTAQCVPSTGGLADSSQQGSGVSKGALAGAIIGALIFLAAAVSLFLWYRRTNRASAGQVTSEVKDTPAAAETVLNRPDPIEKTNSIRGNSIRVYSTSSNTTIDLDPESQLNATNAFTRSPSTGSAPSNPFDDSNSIQTAGTEGTNVIPIALVSPESTTSNGPTRPVRSPDLHLNYNLEHVNVSGDSIRPPAGYAPSQISGISGMSRNSFMSNASYSSDLLNEAPMIVTANKGDVRQVLGVVKPEVISANTLSTAGDSLKPPPSFKRRTTSSSPLASNSYGPSDMGNDSDTQSLSDPFDDKHCSTVTNLASPAASVATFGQPSPLPMGHTSTNAEWGTPVVPYVPKDGEETRPSSMFTQAGSVIGIENATRVNLGMSYASEENVQTATVRSPYRTTMGRLVTPPTSASTVGTLEEQQQKALAHARAQAQAQDPGRRISGSSVLSSASTRTDSILESFPFVPPSPISNRPMRTPPVSPLVQQTFTTATAPSSPLTKQSFKQNGQTDSGELSPPNRHYLGLSTASQFSTASSGLGSFPFHIDSGGHEVEPATASSYAETGRQRASLDTLAITNELASYPLGFDRDSTLPYKPT